MILHGDLPNLPTDDVAALLDALPAGPAASRSRRIGPGAGTNGLALRPPDAIALPIRCRLASPRTRPRREAAGMPIVEVHRPGLAFDLDTPADLARWIELGDAA